MKDPYSIRITVYAKTGSAGDDVIFGTSVPVTAEDVVLGIPARVLGQVTQKVAAAVDAIQLAEAFKRKKQVPQTLTDGVLADLQE